MKKLNGILRSKAQIAIFQGNMVIKAQEAAQCAIKTVPTWLQGFW